MQYVLLLKILINSYINNTDYGCYYLSVTITMCQVPSVSNNIVGYVTVVYLYTTCLPSSYCCMEINLKRRKNLAKSKLSTEKGNFTLLPSHILLNGNGNEYLLGIESYSRVHCHTS